MTNLLGHLITSLDFFFFIPACFPFKVQTILSLPPLVKCLFTQIYPLITFLLQIPLFFDTHASDRCVHVVCMTSVDLLFASLVSETNHLIRVQLKSYDRYSHTCVNMSSKTYSVFICLLWISLGPSGLSLLIKYFSFTFIVFKILLYFLMF